MVSLARNGDRPLREVAVDIGITERAVQRIVADLEDGGYLKRERIGRRNTYSLIFGKALRHQLEAHHTIGDVLRVLAED
jgi:DNA-binding Lrp family transcriptional regulator